jgi:putative acetyltransferase
MPRSTVHEQFVFRQVIATDVPAVVAHVRQVLAEFDITFGVGAASDQELLDLPQSYVGRGGAFWVAQPSDSPRIVGTAGVVPLGDGVIELRKMYLLPETRGLGVGAALFDLALAHARSHGAQRMVLDTVDRMRDAIAFYERRGFVRDDSWISASRCSRGYVLELGSKPGA